VSKALKILIADDTEANLALVSLYITKLGHTAIQARDGQEAVALFQADPPDVVLMDVMMPVMDGYQATAEIKRLAGDKWVPVIFLSAKVQDEDQIRGLEVGGDDYLTKPINLAILHAKIRAMQRIAEMQRKITENAEQLARYHEENEREQQLAKHLLEKIIRADKFDDNLIKRWIKPAKEFSGDIIATEFTPRNELYVILADGAGHGLAAALNVVPIVEVFYGMTKKGYGIATIARELNRKIRQLLPTERFVAAALASINFSDRTVEVWNGGMPSPCFVGRNGEIEREWRSQHPPLGIIDDAEFLSKTEIFQWHRPGQLFIYSDGLIEAENAQNERFGNERLLQALSQKNGAEDQFSRLVGAVNHFLNADIAADDISLTAIDCQMNFAGESEAAALDAHTSQVEPSEARLAIKLSANELKSFDLLPWLMGWLTQLHISQRQCQELFLIISELYNNALDHGILALDSSLKSQPEGFGLYLDMREDRLANLQQGVIEIELERMQEQRTPYLRLFIRDSGEGFKADDLECGDIADSTQLAGRGIALVNHLCTRVAYQNSGNEVLAMYPLK
jgi:CheY-like chemotaxis protein